MQKISHLKSDGGSNMDYQKWKRANVTYRGMREFGLPNSNASGVLGRGLYSAPASNRSMAKDYGGIYFVVNGKPKNPKVFDTMNHWEIWMQRNLLTKYSKNEFPDLREFNKNSTIEKEMIALGYDGVEIKGREIVNYTPSEDVKYFRTEDELRNYFESIPEFKDGGNFENPNKINNFTAQIAKDEIQHIISGEGKEGNGKLIQAAISFLRGKKASISSLKKDEFDKEPEARALEEYISKHDLWNLSAEDEHEFIGGGAEQNVYGFSDPDFVLKINDGSFYQSWEQYFNNLLLHNHFFPDTAYELIGFTKYSDGEICPIVKQRYVKSTEKTDLGKVREFMAANGFINTKGEDYRNDKLGIIIEDLHDENVLTKDGDLYFIDTNFYITVPKQMNYGGGIDEWNKWKRENTKSNGGAECVLSDGTEVSIDFVNSKIRIGKQKYKNSLDYTYLKEDYSAKSLDDFDESYSRFDARAKELVFGNIKFELSSDKTRLFEIKELAKGGNIEDIETENILFKDLIEHFTEPRHRNWHNSKEIKAFNRLYKKGLIVKGHSDDADGRGTVTFYADNAVDNIEGAYKKVKELGLLDTVGGRAIERAYVNRESQNKLKGGGDLENSEKIHNFDINHGKNEINNILTGKGKTRESSAIEAASSYLRGCAGTGAPYRSKAYKAREKSCLENYIDKNSLWFDDDIIEGKYLTKGGESQVYLVGNDVIKLNKADFYENCWQDYFTSLILHNHFFWDTPYELLGFTYEDGELFAVLKQPYIEETGETDLTEVKKMLEKDGFEHIPDTNQYFNKDLGIRLMDIHNENVLTKNGIPYFIDTIFRVKSSEFKTGGAVDGIITCANCGWQWKESEGGTDKYVCHKCGYDNTPELEKGGNIIEKREQIYEKWKDLVNMSAGELERFYESEEGKKAGLTPEQAKEKGIHYGRESARWIIKMKRTPAEEWTPAMWEWAQRQVSFISRMRGNSGDLYDKNENKTRKYLSLLIWGHNPEKYKSGGELKTGKPMKTKNPFAACTVSIGKVEGTTERSKWGKSAKDKYERCVLSVKAKSFDIKAIKSEKELEEANTLLEKYKNQSDNTPKIAAYNNEGKLVGVVAVKVEMGLYRFNIVASAHNIELGVGNELIKAAIADFEKIKKGGSVHEMYAECVNDKILNSLKRRGFEIWLDEKPNCHTAKTKHPKLKFEDGGILEEGDVSGEFPLKIAISVPDEKSKEAEVFISETFGNASTGSDSVECLINENKFIDGKNKLFNQLRNWCAEWGQDSIGLEFDGNSFEVSPKSNGFYKSGGNVKNIVDKKVELTIVEEGDAGRADIEFKGIYEDGRYKISWKGSPSLNNSVVKDYYTGEEIEGQRKQEVIRYLLYKIFMDNAESRKLAKGGDLNIDGKAHKTIIDEDGTKWDAVSKNKSGIGKYDIYRNGEIQSVGANKSSDIEPTINQLRESKKQSDDFAGTLNWGKKGSGNIETTNDFKDYIVEVSPKYNNTNSVIGANLTISTRNADGSLTIKKQKSDYKSVNEAKRDTITQVGALHKSLTEKKAEGGEIEEPTTLYISDKNPLSKQLQRLTGDSWGMLSFDVLGEGSSEEIFRHKKTGKLFKAIVDKERSLLPGRGMPNMEKGGKMEPGKHFIWTDKTGREKSLKLVEEQIRNTWDLEEMNEDEEQTLGEFLDDCYIGDTWETRTEKLECDKIIDAKPMEDGGGINFEIEDAAAKAQEAINYYIYQANYSSNKIKFEPKVFNALSKILDDMEGDILSKEYFSWERVKQRERQREIARNDAGYIEWLIEQESDYQQEI